MTTPLEPGAGIAFRNCVRGSRSRDHEASYVSAMTVVHDDEAELALYRGPGYPRRRRNAELISVPGFRHQPVRSFSGGWRVDPPWSGSRVLVLMDPRARHAISLFWDAAPGELKFWYIDLIGPVTRREFGFDFIENGLDIVVEPDFSPWRWKDEDELDWNVREGIYTRAEADELYREGERAVDRLFGERQRFEQWRSWLPDPAWPIPTMPAGWDTLDRVAS